MNTSGKVFFGFLSGAVIGGGISAFVTRIYLTRRHNAEIAQIREDFRKDRRKAKKAEKPVEIVTPEKSEEILPGGILKREIKDEDRTPYASYYDETNVVEEGVIPEFKPTTHEDRINNITIISSDEFYSDKAHYKIDLTYYKNSNILVDDKSDTVIDEGDWVTTCGDQFVNYFGYEKDEPLCVFVRNENTSTDYTIYLEDDPDNDPYFSPGISSLEEGE